MAKSKSNTGRYVAIVVLCAAAFAGWRFFHKSAAVAYKYETKPVELGDVVQTVTANGQLNPLVTVDVGAQVNGNIVKLYADYNSKVTNNQLIAELDPATYQARYISAKSDLASAKAQYNLSKVNARRAADLLASKLISEADYDQSAASLEQADAALQVKQASLDSAEVDLSRTKIYSPMDGTVISRSMSLGQTVQASFSAPTLFQIANDLTRMQIAAMVSEADIGGIEESQEVNFTVEAFPSRTFKGTVSQVRNQPTTNQNVVTYGTIIDVNNPDMKLKPGMTANVTITTAKHVGVARLSNAALRFAPPEEAVVRTNVILLAGASKAEVAAAAAPVSDGLPADMPAEFRKTILKEYDKNGDGKLDAAELKAWQDAMRARMAQGGGPGGPGGMGGGPGGPGGPGGSGMGGGPGGASSRPASDGQPTVKTVYLLATNALPGGAIQLELQPVQVRLGINDGSYTEVLEGLKVGADVVSVAVEPETTDSEPVSNPFGPFGGRRPR